MLKRKKQPQTQQREVTVILRDGSSKFINFLVFFREIMQWFCQPGRELSCLLHRQFNLLDRDMRSWAKCEVQTLAREKSTQTRQPHTAVTWTVRVQGQARVLSRQSRGDKGRVMAEDYRLHREKGHGCCPQIPPSTFNQETFGSRTELLISKEPEELRQ